jgi:hypothetical protein
MILCGWCGHPTSGERCSSCGRDPRLPYVQRAQEPVPFDDRAENRAKLAQAEREISVAGVRPTIDQLAEFLDVSPRTVRRWRGDGR